MKKVTFLKDFRSDLAPGSKNFFFSVCCFILFLGQNISAQSVLIDPTAEGGFESGSTFADNGWETVDATPNAWALGSVPGWFTGNGAYVSSDTGTTWGYTNTVISRSSFYRDVTFPAGAISVNLSFDWRANGNDGNWDNLLVYIMDTSVTPTTAGPVGQGTTATGWPGYTNGTTGYFLLQRNGTSVPTTTTNVTYSLTAAQLAYVSGNTKRLVFVWKNDGGGGANPPAAVDNISLVAFTCAKPTTLVTSAYTATTATLGWTAPATAPANGYDYEVRTSGAAGSGNTGLVTDGSTSDTNFSVTDLTANTTYTYYVRSACASDDFSEWVSATFFTGYCQPSSTANTSYINNFSTTGGTANISNLASGYTTGGYQNNYATATVSQYATGTINFASDIVGGTVGTSIWVDWNNDLVFDNTTERVFATTAYGNNQTGSFTVPAGTAEGDYRMRIRIDWSNPIPDACSNINARTEAEDYKLTVIAPPTCMPISGLTAAATSPFAGTLNWTASVSSPANGYDYYVTDSATLPTGTTTVTGTVGAGIVTTPAVGLNPSTAYYAYVRSNCGSGDVSTWSTVAKFTTPCNPPTITATTPGAVCGQGAATLTATPSAGDIKWYAAATGGTALLTGNSYTTPSLTTTTSYWAEAVEAGAQATVGPVSPTAQGGTTDNQTIAWEVNFTVLSNTTLASVDIFPITAGQNGAIVVRSSTGTIIATYPYTTSVSGGTTAQTVVINHAFVPGNYQLYPTLPTAGLKRNTSGAVYPYTSSVANITGNGYLATYYMGFYNWTFGTSCASPRTEVVATVSAPPALTLSTTSTAAVCSGQPSAAVTIATGAASYDTYVWSPAGGVTGNAATGWAFAPSTTTTYTLTASQSTGTFCQTTATVTVNVNANPVISASASNAVICEGSSSTLTAVAITSLPGTVALGTATTLTGAQTQPTAFCNRFKQYWSQTVFTAAELQAAGLAAGNINSIAYTITTLGDASNVTAFEIRIGTTANATTTAFVTTGLSQVYGPATYTYAVGSNTINFSTPYLWDGTSNIILDVRQVGADNLNNSITRYTATTANTTVVAITSTAPATNTLQTLVANSTVTPTFSTQRLNIVFGGQIPSNAPSTLDWTWNPGALTGSSITVSPTASTTYTVRGTNAATGCFTEATTAVTVNLAPAPTGNSVQTFEVFNSSEATVANLVATGNNIVWYATQADAISQLNPLPSTTQLVNNEDYFAMQTTAQGCRSIAPLAVTVTVTLGTSSFDLKGLKYYPNPVTNVLNVEYTGTITGLEVYNMLGQKMAAKNVNEITTTIDMSNLASGSYFVKVKAENGSRTIKVMKN